MAVTPAMIKDLREKTQAGMLDCKKALNASDGDFDGAIEWLRKKGLSKVSKVANKIAAEGTVAIKINEDYTKATLTEVNCQTDFVAKNENFVAFSNEMTEYIHAESIKTTKELSSAVFDGQTYE